MPVKSSKVFVRRGDETVGFMWADVSSDGSVMMGLLAEAHQEVDFVVDAEHGEIHKAQLVTEPRLERPKINFHATGKYKFDIRMGLEAGALDRATVEGPPLSAISAPRRMLEVLLPRSLPASRFTPTPGDIILTVDEDNP